jgi:hypothetical protein
MLFHTVSPCSLSPSAIILAILAIAHNKTKALRKPVVPRLHNIYIFA